LFVIPYLSVDRLKCYGESNDDRSIYFEVIQHYEKGPWKSLLLVDHTVIDTERLPFTEKKENGIENFQKYVGDKNFPLLSIDMMNDLQTKNKCSEILDKETFDNYFDIQLISEEQLLSYGKTYKELVAHFIATGEEFIGLSRIGYSQNSDKALVILISRTFSLYILTKSHGKWEIAQVVGEGFHY
jgi:hypothetical protein